MGYSLRPHAGSHVRWASRTKINLQFNMGDSVSLWTIMTWNERVWLKNKAETEKILSLVILFSLNSSHHESRQDRVPFGSFFLSGFHKVNPCVMLRKCTVLPELPTRAGLWRVKGGADLFLCGRMSHSLYQIFIHVWFCELVALGVLGLWVWAGSEQPDPIWNHRHFWLSSTCL